MELDTTCFNPLLYHLLRYLPDPQYRYIMLWGGSSSGKSYSAAQALLLIGFREGTNTMVYRKVGASIESSIYADFRRAAEQLGMSELLEFRHRRIRFKKSGAVIDFKGLDDTEKIKGLSSYKRIYMDEWSEFDEANDDQMRLRLRGVEGQQIIYSWNPISDQHWIKKNRIDREEWTDVPAGEIEVGDEIVPAELCKVKSLRINKPTYLTNPRTGEAYEHPSDAVLIQTTYLNNYWVVGSPDGTFGYYDEQVIAQFERLKTMKPEYYKVYALGEWGIIQTGSEFFGSFNIGKHVGKVEYDSALPIHISVDNNRLPYISCSFWQVATQDKTVIRQIDEICATPPNNTARKSAVLVANRLKEYGVDEVYLHGDATTRNGNTIDDDNRSFLDLFIDVLEQNGIKVIDRVGNKNPSVPMSGEFINAIYDLIIPDVELVIGERCNISIDDYLSVQKDVNGAIAKTKVKDKATGQSYEEHGHLSDCKRYLVIDALKEEFYKFSNQRKRNLYARDGAISFYNPDTVCAYSADMLYAVPNINGKLGLVHGHLCGERWHIRHAELCETSSTDEISAKIRALNPSLTVIECGPSYYPFVRELRKVLEGVKVMREQADIDRRIAATSDYVRSNVLFNEVLMNEDENYTAFVSNMLDYNKNGESREASTVISGFARFAIKSFSNMEEV